MTANYPLDSDDLKQLNDRGKILALMQGPAMGDMWWTAEALTVNAELASLEDGQQAIAELEADGMLERTEFDGDPMYRLAPKHVARAE